MPIPPAHPLHKLKRQFGAPSSFAGPVIPNPDNRKPQLDTEAPAGAPTVKPIPTRGWMVGPQKQYQPFDTEQAFPSTVLPGAKDVKKGKLPLREQ